MATWYSAGMVDVVNGSATINGNGTAWVANVQVGDAFIGPDFEILEVDTIVSNTEITLVSIYLGATNSAQAYRIKPTMGWTQDTMTMLSDFQDDVDDMLDGPGQGKFTDEMKFIGDEDTGMRRLASNKVALFAGDVDQVIVEGGVASGAAVQSNLKDATVGKLMKVGAFGWGIDNASLDSSPGDDLDALTIQGVWRYSSGTTGAPSTAGNVIHLTRLSGAYMQLAISNTGLMYLRSSVSSVWANWVEIAQQGASVSFADIIGTGLLTLGGNAIGGEMQTIADDAVGTFTPPRNGGFARITCAGTGPTPTDTLSCDIFYDVGSSLLIKKSTGWATLGSSVAVVDTDVTGTTGIDGGATIAVQSGVIKVENRIGGARTFEATYG